MNQRNSAMFFSTHKVLNRLGDCAAIALIKLSVMDDYSNPRTATSFLSTIRDSFAEPQFIEGDEDKLPGVTMILLHYLVGVVQDAATKEEIRETIWFVQQEA
jgi:hypothetical protein